MRGPLPFDATARRDFSARPPVRSGRMPRPPLCRRRGAALVLAVLVAASCASDSGVRTDAAEQIGPPPTPTAPATTTPDTAAPPATSDRGDEPTPTDSDGTVAPPPSSDDPVSEIDWQSITDDLDQAVLDVPIDYDEPEGDTFGLFLVRRPATDQQRKIGTLLINPGGPGAGG